MAGPNVPKVPPGRAVRCLQNLIEFLFSSEMQTSKKDLGGWKPKFGYFFTALLPRQGMPKGADFIRTSSAFRHFTKTSKQPHIRAMATQPVELAEVERLSPLVIRVLAGNPGNVCILTLH